MPRSKTGFGNYRLIIESEGKFISKPVVALAQTERPTVAQLNSYLPSLALPRPGVEFALLWSANDDSEMNYPVFTASISVTMKWADYNLDGTEGESFIDYLNRVNNIHARSGLEDAANADMLRYIMNRVDISPQESMKLVVMPPDAKSVEYEQLVTRPGEIFMLLLYVEKRLSYHLVSRHPDVFQLYNEIAAAQKEDQISEEFFDTWWAKLEPLQMTLIAKNSDKGFSGLINDLDQEMLDILPDTLREDGISNLRELGDIRNTIGHSTIYNGMVVGEQVVIAPHITKHTAVSSRETITTHFDDETYELIKSMIEKAHKFLEACIKVPPKWSIVPNQTEG